MENGRQGLILWKGLANYGRLARSHEHSPGFAVSGSESGHALQVRRRTENSGVQAGEPLALQEVEAGSVDGREIKPDGSADEEETEGSSGESWRHIRSHGGGRGCPRHTEERRRAHVWIRIEDDCWSGCGLLEH